jgi:polyphosphate kinase 2 (PPK2 family)
VVAFEEMLVKSGIRLLKYYLDVGRREQKRRLRARRASPEAMERHQSACFHYVGT